MVTGTQVRLSVEKPRTLPSGAVGNSSAIGHGSWPPEGVIPTANADFGMARPTLARMSETLAPTGTAPGCQLNVADASSVLTAPASPATAVVVRTTGVGSGSAVTTAVGSALLVPEPVGPAAPSVSPIVEPMSPGVTTYWLLVAPAIGVHESPFVSQRSHCWVKVVAEPLQSPVSTVSVCPTSVSPSICGGDVAVGTVLGVEVGVVTTGPVPEIATVAGDAALTEASEFVAVTSAVTVRPLSAPVSV